MSGDFGGFDDSLTEKELYSILGALPEAVIVARAVRSGGAISDFKVVFTNDACRSCIDERILSKFTMSGVSQMLPTTVPWGDIADKAMNGIAVDSVTYHSSQTNLWLKLNIRKVLADYLVVTLENLTVEKLEDTALQKTAYFDIITGLPNRNKFKCDIPAIIENAQFNGTKLGFLLLDVDNMKAINDYLGHDSGDQLLRRVVNVLAKFSANIAQTYRMGGDEFTVIIKNAPNSDAVANISDAIMEAFNQNSIGISGGLALFPDDSGDLNDILRFCDVALLASKKNGKNRITLFDLEMHRAFVQKYNMQLRMVKGVLNSEFYLVFQPQFSLKSDKLLGFEALLRWRDGGEEVLPDVFLPIAEESGLMSDLGTIVFDKAFSTLSAWKKAYNYNGTLCINLSAAQLRQADFMTKLHTLLAQYAVDPGQIEIEVTEEVVAPMANDITQRLSELHAMGFCISLDDFGTRGAQLKRLRALPLSTIKIDKSLIADLLDEESGAAVINLMISIISRMGIKTTAIGVEDPRQLEALEKSGCTSLQGFLKSPPMTKEECDKYLREHQGK